MIRSLPGVRKGWRWLPPILLLGLTPASVPLAAATPSALRETFDSLEDWRPLVFPRIPRSSTYSLEREGEESFLRAESAGSASGLIHRRTFDPATHPLLRWRWRISSVYRNDRVEERAGDDYPIRIYVVFPYDPGRAGFGRRLAYQAARLVYGEYPPDSALSYVWSSRPGDTGVRTSPATDRAKLVVLRSGAERAGEWVTEEVDVLSDYRRAFGTDPPGQAGLAVMNDSDDTGESSVSWLDDLEVRGPGGGGDGAAP